MSEAVSRIPPMNLEAEQSLLGSMMLSEEAVVKAVEMITADDFYQVSHRHIFQALLDLFEAQKPCDAVTLQEMLRSRNCLMEVGGATYLSQLLNSVPTAANAEHYAVIVREKSILRKLISVTGEISKQAYEAQAEVEELLDSAETKMMALSHFRITQPYVPMKSLVREVFAHLEYLYENKVGVTGVPSGFSALDQFTSGFQNSDLIIIAARPSMGKTAFTLNVAQNVASKGLPVLFFSLEMGCKQLVQRIMCSEARIDGQKLRSGFLGESDWPKLTMVSGELEQTPLFIDDTPNASLLEIRSKARRALSQEGIKLIMIDYLQLITHQVKGNGDRQQEISAISRGLKGLARELNVPVICLSQLSRAVESRTDKRPMLSDLRESGAIEQDADIVMFLYRDIYYNPKKEESRNKAEVIIAKQRNGPVGNCELAFFSEYARFDNLESSHHYND